MVGHFTITSVLLQKAKKFGFSIILMTYSLRFYEVFPSKVTGNTLLKRKQYEYNDIDIAKFIIKNKIQNQIKALKKVYNNSATINQIIKKMNSYIDGLDKHNINLSQILGLEGSASKLYFQYLFTNVVWNGRRPRVKDNMVNAILDIGYTILFNIIEFLLNIYGFDVYVGILHKEFYMRKSLVCDLVEPLRPTIDYCINKAIGLKQFKKEDFLIINNRYVLKYEVAPKYVDILMKTILNNKNDLFLFIQSYYRSFMRGLPAKEFKSFDFGG